jgi:non-ribosomal peptide synthetase component E (peptide arylation enzyme)
VLRDGEKLGLDELVEGLRAQGIATFKLPQAFARVDALPMTSTGKIKKHELITGIDNGSIPVETA